MSTLDMLARLIFLGWLLLTGFELLLRFCWRLLTQGRRRRRPW